MAKIKEKKTENFEISDIVSIKINAKKMVDYAVSVKDEMEEDDHDSSYDKNKIKEIVKNIENDLKGLKGEIVSVDGATAVIKFDVKKDWMTRLVSSDNEFLFDISELTLVKRPDKVEALLSKFNNEAGLRITQDIERTNRLISDNRASIESYRIHLNRTLADMANLDKKREVLEKNKSKNISFDAHKCKRIVDIQADESFLYLLTEKLPYYSKSGNKLIEKRDQFVIKINPYSGGYGNIQISNISSYYPDSRSSMHCCVSGFNPCLGPTMQRSLEASKYDINLYINMLVSYLEKPDYEQPYIREDIYKEKFIEYSKEFDKSDLRKAFDFSNLTLLI